jgi:hypothetical protein
MTDIDKSFDWHAAAIRGTRGPIDADNPKAGFYRTKAGRDGPYIPIAFWYDSATGELRCHKNGRSIDDMAARELWVHAARNPIPQEMYWTRIDIGVWTDEDTSAAATAKGPEIDPEADPAGSLAAEIAAAKAGLAAYATIDSDEQSAKAQTLRSALTGLSGKATKAYEALNRPLLDEQQRIRKVWFPLRDEAADAADSLRKAMGKWEDVKRDNARRAADEAAKAAREAEEAGKPAPPPPPQNTPAPSTKIKGASGRAASVQLKKVVTTIDIDKAFAQFRDDPELYAFLLDLSQKVVNAGYVAIGATVEEKADIR